MRSRWPLKVLLCALLVVICAGCSPTGAEAPRTASGALSRGVVDRLARIDLAQARALRYLLAHQSSDGAWRSETYGFLKDGPSLTAHVTGCVQIRREDSSAQAAFKRAAN